MRIHHEMEEILTVDIFFSFITLSLLEIVLGIDNLVFIALVVQRLPAHLRRKVRYIGLSLALFFRIAMLMGIAWLMTLTKPLLTIVQMDLSTKDLLLIAGGLFLLVKSTLEMHHDISASKKEAEGSSKEIKVKQYFTGAVIQVVIIDIIFSLDSIITAVGMTTNVPVIVAAMVVAMFVMIACSGYLAEFISRHPTFKMLAISFILMIGTLLIAEGLHFHVPRGYIYFAFSFSIFVEAMNTLVRKNLQNT